MLNFKYDRFQENLIKPKKFSLKDLQVYFAASFDKIISESDFESVKYNLLVNQCKEIPRIMKMNKSLKSLYCQIIARSSFFLVKILK